MKTKLINRLFKIIDGLFRAIDKKHIRRTKNIRLIPEFKNRRGGKLSYAEWAHVIGIFQTIIYQNINKKNGNKILDIGCGTGLLGISSESFVQDGGIYNGLDVMKNDIKFCKKHYKMSNYKFTHFDLVNPTYAKNQKRNLTQWPIKNNSMDLVTALSVWTHLCERDAKFYFNEIHRVLRKGGKAIITFFYLDKKYQESLPNRKDDLGRFHSTNQNSWIFDTPAYESKNWFSPNWAKNPEAAIGITTAGMEIMIKSSKLRLIEYYPGNWKEFPGVYFQDILIFEK